MLIFIQRILIVIFMTVFVSLQGMDRPTIIDLNDGDAPQFTAYAPVVVMGYTPNFSKFQKFCVEVLKAYGDALNPPAAFRSRSGELVVPKNQLSQKFGKEIAKSLSSYLQNDERNSINLCAQVEQFLSATEKSVGNLGPYFEVFVDLFLAHCFDRPRILSKACALLDGAREVFSCVGANDNVKNVIHTFVPYPYFQEAKAPASLVHRYLRRCALYYKGLYEEAECCQGLQVLIVVPRIESTEQDPFVTCCSEAKPDPETLYEPGLKCNINAIQSTLIRFVENALDAHYFFLNTVGTKVDFDPSNNLMASIMNNSGFNTTPCSVVLLDGTLSLYRSSSECCKDVNLCNDILRLVNSTN